MPVPEGAPFGPPAYYGPPASNGWTPDVKEHVFDAIEAVRREQTELAKERDRRYTERSAQQDKAVVDALAAAKEAVSAALVAADKAVGKEEANAEKWRSNANEWRQAMDDRETRFLGKEEATLMVSALDGRLGKLEIARERAVGIATGTSSVETADLQARTQRSNQTMVLLFAMSTLVGIVAVILSIVLKT